MFTQSKITIGPNSTVFEKLRNYFNNDKDFADIMISAISNIDVRRNGEYLELSFSVNNFEVQVGEDDFNFISGINFPRKRNNQITSSNTELGESSKNKSFSEEKVKNEMIDVRKEKEEKELKDKKEKEEKELKDKKEKEEKELKDKKEKEEKELKDKKEKEKELKEKEEKELKDKKEKEKEEKELKDKKRKGKRRKGVKG